jgi:hypothetical protein
MTLTEWSKFNVLLALGAQMARGLRYLIGYGMNWVITPIQGISIVIPQLGKVSLKM